MNEILPSYVNGNWWMPEAAAAAGAAEVRDASTGEVVTRVSTEGLDLGAALEYARTVGQASLGELTFHQLAGGADLQAVGYEVDDPDAMYHVSSRQAFIWPYDERARLVGENLYEDKTSLEIEEVSPDEAITPARVREIHHELLAKLEAQRGEHFWVYDDPS